MAVNFFYYEFALHFIERKHLYDYGDDDGSRTESLLSVGTVVI